MIPPGKKREASSLLVILLVLCACVVWLRTATVKDTYRYVQQEKELSHLEQEIQAVRIRWLQLTAPKRLEALADKLDLHPPARNQILRYEATEASTP